MTTAIYARISDDRHDGVGVANQLDACRAWCAAEGWEPVSEYVDNDVSASVYARKPRKAYAALLRAVEAGEVSQIVCWAVDRLYRQPRELETLIPLADAGRVDIRSKVGGDLDLSTSGGRLTARLFASIGAHESELRSERIRLAQNRARSNGDPHGGARPFGWLALGKSAGGRSWDPRKHDPAEADLIRQAAAAVLDGARVADVARRWNDARIPQASGIVGRWFPTTIRSVLTNPRNAALVNDHGALAPGQWEPILDRPTWERVGAELRRRAERFGTLRRLSYLLSGVLVCGRCGASLSHGITRRSVVYRCHKGPGAPGCGRVQIAAEPLERDVTAALFAYIDGADLAKLARPEPDDPTADISRELAQLEAAARETADLAARGAIRPADFARFSSGVEERQRGLRARLARLSGHASLELYAGRPGVLRAAWAPLTTSQRRGLILAALGRLVVDPAARQGYDFGRVRRTTGGARP
jgi:site-specific DNA recombinase